MKRPELSSYLWTFRKRSGLTQSELAFLVNVAHRTAVSKHECGETEPALETLLCYEVLFAVTTHELYEDYAGEIGEQVAERARVLLAQLNRARQSPIVDRKILTLRGVLSRQEGVSPG